MITIIIIIVVTYSLLLSSLHGLQVNSKYVAEDLVQDFDAGLEYAEADCIVDVQNRGDSRQYLIRYWPLYDAFSLGQQQASLQLRSVHTY